MKDWFDSLDIRRQQFVSIGAVIVFVALTYGLGWAPLDKKHAELKSDVAQWQRSIADLRSLRVMVASADQSAVNSTIRNQQSPIIIVDQTLRSRGLDGYRKSSQPTSNGIRIEFENVAFDELVLWLGDLSEQYAMHVQAGSFSAGPRVAPGRINASLTLERAL